MPRNRKRKKTHKQHPAKKGSTAPRSSLDKKKAKWWKRQLRNAIKAKEPYAVSAAEVDAYFQSIHDELFNSELTRNNFLNFKGAVAVSVPKSAQVRNSLGPHLYVQNPVRQFVPRGVDTIYHALGRALEIYVNRTPGEAKLEKQMRKRTDDGLLRGRGFMFTGFDSILEIVTSWQITSRDVLIDGSADELSDAEWIAIRRKEPLFRVKREIPEAWRKKGLKGNLTADEAVDDDGEQHDDRAHKEEENEHGPTNDMVEIWDVYSKMGTGIMGADFPDNRNRKDPGADDDFVKLSIVLTHPVPIYEGPWEVPFYLDRDWPIEALDLIETLDKLWPESVMSQVMPLQKATDLLTSLELISARNRGRTIFYGDKSEEKRVQELFKSGEACVYVGFEPDAKRTPMSQRFGAVDLGRQTPEIQTAREFLLREFEATTGLTSATTGSDDQGAKDRSATASRIRSQASTTRIGDMSRRVMESDTNVARHEAITTRLWFEGPDEAKQYVAPYVPPEEIGFYLVSITPPDAWVAIFGVDEFPVRDRRTEEERERGEDEITMQMLGSQFSRYYATMEEAAQATMEAMQAVEQLAREQSEPFMYLAALWDNTGGQGFSAEAMFPPQDPMNPNPQPGPGLPEGVTPRLVTVEDIWRDTAGISPKELFRELGFSIYSSGGPEFNKEAEIEAANNAMAQAMGPAMTVMQATGNPEPVNALFKRVDDALDIPQENRLPPLPALTPPQPAGAPQGPPQ